MVKPSLKIKTKLRHDRGFALVATLALMILLTMVAVGLLSLSAVSLRASSQGNAAAEARANARMALMMAIGELQKELGPDSRITAPHDAGTTATGGKPRWTAVYDAWELPTDPNAPESPASRNPKFRTWLVSGANQATGGPAGTGEDAELVGQASLARNAAAVNQIKAPMLAVTRGGQKGRIAWWSADESVKARINAGPEDTVAGNPLFNAQSAPHAGHQAIEVLKNLKWKPGQRSIAVTNGGVNLAAELGNSGIGNMDHDATVHSAGVLCDVRAGRLKRDLSNLLTYPVEDLQNKPLYLADGRMNRFNITEAGAVANRAGIPSSPSSALNTPGEWGVNLEELHLFHNIHRDLDWNGGNPNLKMKGTREQVVNDRYYLYKRPVIDAVQFILSLKAEPYQGKYRMVMMLDGMVALSNPNDVPIVWPAGLIFPVQLQNVPYGLKWNIQRADGTVKNTNNASTSDFGLFVGRIGGGAAAPAAGFTLAPGESAVFGSTTGSGPQLDLMRGFKPSGGVRINPNASNGWDLKATNLDPTDLIDFTLTKGDQGFQGTYTYYNAWIGDRKTGAAGKAMGWQTDSCSLSFGGDINSARMNELLISPIRPSETKAVGDYASPQPVMKISFLRNVERNSGSTPPDAFASRPFQLAESAAGWSGYSPSTLEPGLHAYQRLITAEPANFKFDTFAAGEGGRSIYQGGGRYLTLGGSFNVIRRRIPMAAPLSLGAFENAIASGFAGRFKDAPAIAGDPFPSNASALCGDDVAWPEVSKVIGNSHGTPYLNGDQVYRAGSGGGAATRTAADHSWMANTALWDSWFLSSIVDGRGIGSNLFQQDARSPRKQFEDLANQTGKLRNTRYLFHPHRSPSDAIKELFDGETLKKSALNSLAGYLLVDGPFNVNSTSADAWKALLSSVRDHELLVNGGATRKFGMPYGTIGYAQDISTSNDWTGLRDLSDTEIRTLASAIVDEVKARGPFLSLADFVNRRPNSTVPQQQALGALQAAIDKSGLNSNFAGDKRTVAKADFAALLGSDSITPEPVPARALGTAGHLTQAKLLTAIGSQITVRSDTFIIRSYGDARDASGKITASAWCEATVQRLPEYVDPANQPEYEDGWPTDTYTLSSINSRFGRRWEIKSFRWLNSAEVL
jgi:Tfp pilus assembly protein PilX